MIFYNTYNIQQLSFIMIMCVVISSAGGGGYEDSFLDA